MKFVEITENYRVNVESIFSLERRIVPNQDACNEYDTRLQEVTEEAASNPPQLMCNGELYSPIYDPNAKTNPQYEEYAKQLKTWMIERIGEQPPLYVYENYVVLATGLKVQLSDSKYEAILKAVESMNDN